MLQQVDGLQRTRDKLPCFASMQDWWYPVRLSCEQCSSEATAVYKSRLLPAAPFSITDLTGGYGVDTYFMSEHAREAHYVERNEELSKIVAHNFEKTRPHVHIHNTDALAYLSQMSRCDVIYLDPARRNQHGGKVFRLEDCEPNVIDILPILRDKAELIIIKLSPMLDITQALERLEGIWDVHILAVRNEVKEILLVSTSCGSTDKQGVVYAANLVPNPSSDGYMPVVFAMTREKERQAQCQYYDARVDELSAEGAYIYEPNAAIIKAGAFKLVSERYGLCKMAPNTHLYVSKKLVKDFPGRVWQIMDCHIKETKNTHASVLTRNYPLTAEQLRKKLKLKESDIYTIIGARLADKPTLFLAKRIHQHSASS